MLTAEELMIGDWVSSPSGRALKVVELTKDFCRLDNSQGCAADVAPVIEFMYACLHPIPLTPKHLENNKWKLDRSGYWDCKVYCYNVGKEVDVRVHFGDDGYLFAFGAICPVLLRYIHQLQHFLKDVGLAELAKNFKI